MNPTVLFENILVKKIERETVKNGLIIPVSNNENHIKCEVIAAGSKVQFVKVGDKLAIPSYRGIPFEHEDQKYLIIKEEEILAILKD